MWSQLSVEIEGCWAVDPETCWPGNSTSSVNEVGDVMCRPKAGLCLPRPCPPTMLPREETDKPAARMDPTHSGGPAFLPGTEARWGGVHLTRGPSPPPHDPRTREEVRAWLPRTT